MRYRQNMRSFGENKARIGFFTGQLAGVILLGLNCLTPILSASPNMMHFVSTFSIMRA